MKKQKLDKSIPTITKKWSNKFVNRLYFDPRYRMKLRETSVKARDSFLKILGRPLEANPDIQKAKERYWADIFSYQMSRMIDLIDNFVPKKLKEWELTDCRFDLYKKPESNYLVIVSYYKKGIPKKHYKTCLLIPSGFPKNGMRTKVKMIRGDYNLKGFELIDSGTFSQKFKNFKVASETYKGRKRTYKFELSQRGKIRDDNWLRLR
jgi:hypothetical protein